MGNETANIGKGRVPLTQARKAGNLVFVSGQMGIDPGTGNISPSFSQQARIALENLRNIVESLGLGLEDVVKTTVFIADRSYFEKMNDVYSEYFVNMFPARSTVVANFVRSDALIEIEAVAFSPSS